MLHFEHFKENAFVFLLSLASAPIQNTIHTVYVHTVTVSHHFLVAFFLSITTMDYAQATAAHRPALIQAKSKQNSSSKLQNLLTQT